VAGDVLADVPRHESRLKVVFAADADADQDVHRLAAIEVGNRIRLSRHGGGEEAQNDRAAQGERLRPQGRHCVSSRVGPPCRRASVHGPGSFIVPGDLFVVARLR